MSVVDCVFIPVTHGKSGDTNATRAIARKLVEEAAHQDTLSLFGRCYGHSLVTDEKTLENLPPAVQEGTKWSDRVVLIYSGAEMIRTMQGHYNDTYAVSKIATTHLSPEALLTQNAQDAPDKNLDARIELFGLSRLFVPAYSFDKTEAINFKLHANDTVPVLPAASGLPTQFAFNPKPGAMFCYVPSENPKDVTSDKESIEKLARYMNENEASSVVLLPSRKSKAYTAALKDAVRGKEIQVTDPSTSGILTQQVLPLVKSDEKARIIFPVDSASVCAEVIDALIATPERAIMFEGSAKKNDHNAMARFFYENKWATSLERGMARKVSAKDYCNAADRVASSLMNDYCPVLV